MLITGSAGEGAKRQANAECAGGFNGQPRTRALDTACPALAPLALFYARDARVVQLVRCVAGVVVEVFESCVKA